MSLCDLTLGEAADRLEAGEVTSRALTEACLERIAATDGALGAFLRVTADEALTSAEASDRRRRRGEPRRSALDGVPMALKDNLCTAGVETTAASRILEGFVPPYDATAVARLKAGGAPLLGKLNMDEFAMGSATAFGSGGPTRNPWDLGRVPGGSSGGGAAAVAARQCFAALGSDTGGSIRQPAALTGIVGLRPTYGRVSRYGLMAYASSLDQVGPLARTCADAARVFEVVAGPDPADATTVQASAPALGDLSIDLGGRRLGIPVEYFGAGLDPQVRRAVEDAAAWFADAGATLVELSLPHTEQAVAAYYVVATAEASSNLARYDGVRYGSRTAGADLRETYERTRSEGFGAEVKRRVVLGTYVLSAGYRDAYYLKAQKVRAVIKGELDAAFGQVDALLTPTSPTAAWPVGQRLDDPLAMYLADVFTVGASLAGLPGLSVPCGFTAEGLPVGLQLLGPAFSETRLLGLGQAYERAHDWGRAPGGDADARR